jgi:hypothetical protein
MSQEWMYHQAVIYLYHWLCCKMSTLDYNGERYLSSNINSVILRLCIYLYCLVCFAIIR